jgi:PAS domain S-box-containing protein
MANRTDSILKTPSSIYIPTRASAIKIALFYALAAALWVLCSDWVLHHLVRSVTIHETVSLLQGWLFVGMTASLLWWALDGYFLLIRRSAKLLQETEDRWKRALEGASQAVWDWDTQSNEVIYSSEWKAMLGYETHEIGDTLAEWETRVHPEDLPRVQEALKNHLEGQTPTYGSEHRLRCQNGSFKWILHRGRVTNRKPDGKPLRMVGTISDIHRRKQAEERSRIQHDLMQALAATNQLDDGLRLCLDAAIRADGLTSGGVYLFDPKNRKLNLRVHAGLSKEFVAAVGQYELESPKGLLVTKGVPVYAEFKELRLNQSEVESREGLQSIAILPILNHGQLLGCFNVASRTHGEILPSVRMALETIAATAGEAIARLQVQDALLESEARYRALFNEAVEGIMLLSSDGKELKVNAALARMHGYETPEEMASLRLSDLDTPASAKYAAERVRRVAEGEPLTFEVEHYRKDGSTIPLSVTASRVDLGGKWYLQAFHRDMTEQKRTEEALRQRLELQDQLAKVATSVPGLVYSFMLRPNGSACIPFATAAIEELYGLRPEDVREDFSPVLAQVYPDDREHLQRSIAESARTMQPWHDTFRTCHPRKGEIWVEGHSVPRLEEDGSILWHGFAQDVTARKRSETALQESERRLATLMANLPGMAYRCQNTVDWPMVFVSEGCAALTGHSSTDLGVNNPAYGDLIVVEDRQFVWDGVQQALAEHRPFELTYRIQAADGQIKWVWERGRGVFAEDGGLLFLEGFITDISERKRLEQERESALVKYRTLFDVFPLGITVADPQGRITESNRQASEILGLSAEEHAKRQIGGAEWNFVRPDGTPMPPEEFASVRALRHRCLVENVEMGLVQSPTEITWITATAAPVPLPDVGVVIAFGDISVRKRTEAALRASELKYRVVANNTFDWEFWLSPEGQFLYTSPSCERITGYKPADFEADAGLVLRIVHPDDLPRFQAHHAASLSGHQEEEQEFRVVRADGQVRWIGHVCTPIRDEAGRFLGVRGSNRDITERKDAETHAAQDALRTEFLLELHQRAPQMTDQELYDYVLERAVRLTESAIGFFHRVSEDQRSIILTAWNQEALKNCTALHDSHYPLSEAGNWVDCIRQQQPVVYNDFKSSPNQRGLPIGHVPVQRLMSIPVLWEGKVRIVFGVGNKPLNYNDSDITHLQIVANELHKIMVQRTAQDQVRQLSRAVEQSPVSVVIADTTGAIEYVNPKFTQVSGYSLAEVRGQNPRVLKSGEMPSEQYRQLWHTILAGKEWHGEFHNRKKNGDLHWESASISPITDPSGKITHFVAVKEDITERKRMESFRQALLSLGHQLNSTRDAVGAGRALLNAADQLWQWDAATLSLLDPDRTRSLAVLQVDTIAGKRQELPAGRQGSLTPRMQKVVREGAFLILRDTHEPCVTDSVPFGDTTRLSASIMCVPIRRELEIVGTLSIQSYTPEAYTNDDLNVLQALADYCGGALERIEMEEAHHRADERYRNLVETTFDWVWEVDAEGRYTYSSPKVKDLLGYLPAEVIGKTPFDFMAEEDAQRLRSIFNETSSSGKPFSATEHANRHKDGHLVTLETRAMPVFGENGKWLGHRGMDRDVSERRRLESQLRQAQKLEAVGQLAGGVAHDFNNILAAIMMHLGLLQMNPSLDQEILQTLKELDEESRRAASLTRQLLMFSRRSVLAVKPLDLNDVIANLLKMLSRLIGENVNLVFAGGNALPFVDADAGMLEQILMNLVVNARDAMPRGGRITISTTLQVMGNQEVALDPNRRLGRFVCLAVSDTGTGIDDATLKRIFEPFFTTKEAGKGTGLGLATVYGIVAQHKGWLEVESTMGQGTTFRVFLPAREETVRHEEQASLAETLRRGKETILLVEDEAKVRQTVGQTLRLLGYRVYEAANGQEAMVLWQAHGVKVDLLLTDMVMPEGMTGLELTERLQALKPGLKAIISSGYSAEIVQAGVANKAGIIYLPKPYTAQTLAEVVRDCLDQKTHRK